MHLLKGAELLCLEFLGFYLCDRRVRGLCLRVRNDGAIDKKPASERSRKLQKFFAMIPARRKFSKAMEAKDDLTEPDPDPNPEIVKPSLPVINLSAKWESLPSRYKLLFATGIAYIICNMVRHSHGLLFEVGGGLCRIRSI